MAAEWIKWVKGLSRRAEVLSMAHRLNTDRRVVACACMELWEWADTETVDGHIKGATHAFVDGLVALPGFASAIEGVGWLRSTEQGITLTNWDRHNGESAKQRARNGTNQRAKRLRKAVTKMSPANGDIHGDKTVTRGEERRGEEITPLPPSLPNVRAPPRSNLPCDNPEIAPVARRVVQFYEKTVTAAHGRGCGQDRIIECLNAGFTVDQLERAATNYAAFCKREEKEPRYRQSVGKFYLIGGEFERHLAAAPPDTKDADRVAKLLSDRAEHEKMESPRCQTTNSQT